MERTVTYTLPLELDFIDHSVDSRQMSGELAGAIDVLWIPHKSAECGHAILDPHKRNCPKLLQLKSADPRR
jgi:hypothetical protein